MPNVTLKIDTKQIDRLANELKEFPKEVGEATRLALVRTIDHAITKAGQIVPKYYAVKSREVKETFSSGIKKPTKSNLTCSVTSTGHTLSIAHFPFTPKELPQNRMGFQKGFKSLSDGESYDIKVKIKTKGGFKKINTKQKPFIASTGAKAEDKIQLNVFKRIGNKRLPVAPIRTLSIPQMITKEGVGEQIIEAANIRLGERLEHEIIRQMTAMEKSIRR